MLVVAAIMVTSKGYCWSILLEIGFPGENRRAAWCLRNLLHNRVAVSLGALDAELVWTWPVSCIKGTCFLLDYTTRPLRSVLSTRTSRNGRPGAHQAAAFAPLSCWGLVECFVCMSSKFSTMAQWQCYESGLHWIRPSLHLGQYCLLRLAGTLQDAFHITLHLRTLRVPWLELGTTELRPFP